MSQVELMRSENVLLTFTEGAIREIARVAFLVSAQSLANCVVISQAIARPEVTVPPVATIPPVACLFMRFW
jgi:hypothetical protein